MLDTKRLQSHCNLIDGCPALGNSVWLIMNTPFKIFSVLTVPYASSNADMYSSSDATPAGTHLPHRSWCPSFRKLTPK